MNLTLWILAGLLAVVYLGSGTSKLITPKERLAATQGGIWANVGLVKTIGTLEVLAAVGLILPAVTGIAAILVPVTAVCLVLLMTGALVTHLRRREASGTVVALTCLTLAGFVAWGRFGPVPFIS